MPPKKTDAKSEKGQQKAVEKQKLKVAEDKTFGLKNKNKSKQVQKFIKGVQQAAKPNATTSESALLQKELQQKEEKKKLLQQNALLASLFKGTENVKKISVDDVKKTNPKLIKAEQQIDVYTDQRDSKKQETMEDWDLAKLEEVIKTKHGGTSQAKPTDIVCKYFLDALEKRQYGWFWTCPNEGNQCKYRHCLPPGYVLKKDIPKDDIDEEDAEPIEELIEKERALLPSGGTKVTLETFLAWKEQKEKDRLEAVEAARLAESKRVGGGGLAVLSGRDLFTYDPTLFIDDAAAAGEDDYQEDEEYWKTIVNQNQEIVDSANAEACNRGDDNSSDLENDDKTDQEKSSSSSSSVVVDKKFDSPNVIIGKESLFLEGDIPTLDQLE